MHSVEAIDTAAFRFCNSTLQNPFFDWLMPIASGNPVFFPLLAVLGSAQPTSPPAQLAQEFSGVTAVGVFPLDYHGKTVRWVQIFECRGLR